MKPRSPVLLKLMTRLGELSFEECWLPSERKRWILGIWHPDGRVQINPMPHVVSTIIHECIHEQFPTYGERAVAILVGKLMQQLTDKEIQTIYHEYRQKCNEA